VSVSVFILQQLQTRSQIIHIILDGTYVHISVVFWVEGNRSTQVKPTVLTWWPLDRPIPKRVRVNYDENSDHMYGALVRGERVTPARRTVFYSAISVQLCQH